jgi:hypothetical protein
MAYQWEKQDYQNQLWEVYIYTVSTATETKQVIGKQVGAPTVPSAFIANSGE